MPEEIFENIRLSFMQDLLPVGIAIVERAKEGGPSRILELLSTNEPFRELHREGEPSAESLRHKLDKISPGLGNPVMSVKVSVEDEAVKEKEIPDIEELMQTLSNIENRLQMLEKLL
tara:strand:- start:138 stop:488 length:351 start_codon:yes stop_codon:yes gene_type:complete